MFHAYQCDSFESLSFFFFSCCLLCVCPSLFCCCLCSDRPRLLYQLLSKLSDVLGYVCGNESCWHSELWPLRHKDIQYESMSAQGRLQIGVCSFFPTLSPFIWLRSPTLIYSISLPLLPSPPLGLCIISLLRLIIFFFFLPDFLYHTQTHSEMLPCHNRQWEHRASLLFSSPPVHSAPHWQKWRWTQMQIWQRQWCQPLHVNSTPWKL